MKKLYTLGLMLALLTACPPDTAGAVESGKASYEWKTSVEFPKFGREDIDGQIKGWLTDIILPTTDYTELLTDFELDEDGWTMEIGYALHHPSQSAVSVLLEIFTYPRASAHPMTGYQVMNFSLADGRALGLGDLFGEPQKALEIFAAHAKDLIKADLVRKHPEDFPAGFSDMDWFDEGFEADPENYEALVLEPEGVRVYFQQYQVLPYVFGVSTPLFPLELLEPAKPNREIWPK